jgi:hypothetical protein
MVHATPDPPVRPDEAAGQRIKERKWLPVIGVVAVIGVIAFGGGNAASGESPPPVDVGGIVHLQPARGWEVVDHANGTDIHRVRLRHANTLLDVYAIEGFDASAGELASAFQQQILSTQFDRLTVGGAGETTLASGSPGVAFGYVGVTSDGVAVEGAVTATVGTQGDGAVFDGFAPQGELAAGVGDLREMIDGASVT